MKYKPYDYQKTAIKYILDHPSCGLFLDMGLGKTVSTLTAIRLLRDEYFDIENTLVIAPKRVALDTWPNEIEKWDHTRCLSYTMLTGPRVEREENLKRDVDIYITTRDLVIWLVNYLKKDWFFDTVIVDELSSFKSNQAKRFRALRRVLPKVDRMIGLTGTPKPNTYMDLWSEMFLLDRGERLGKTISEYRRENFISNTWGGYTSYTLIPGKDKKINKKISDICISMKSEDYLDIQEPLVIDKKLSMNKKEKALYKRLERDYVLQLGDTTITALNGAALSNKLLQLANGAVYDEDKNYVEIHSIKLEALKEMSEEGENLLVFYSYRSDEERILKAIPEAVKLEDEDDIKAWNEGKIKMLIAHPASAGHGLNLQGGGHIVVWFGLNWSLELYSQANARLHRLGQKEPVIIYRLLTSGTLDEAVAKSLSEKKKSQDALIESLKAKQEEYSDLIKRTA